MKVTFTIPAIRFPDRRERATREQQLFLQLVEDVFRVRPETCINLAADGKGVKFLVTGEQFAKFIIARTERGIPNWVKELDAKVVGGSYAPGESRWIVDTTQGAHIPRIRRDGVYLMTNPGKPSWAESVWKAADPARNTDDQLDVYRYVFEHGAFKHGGTVTGRWPGKRPELAMGYGMSDEKAMADLKRYCENDVALTCDYATVERRVLARLIQKERTDAADKARTELLNELAEAMDERAAKYDGSSLPRTYAYQAGKRWRLLAADLRAMLTGKSFKDVVGARTVESQQEAAKRHPGNKFTLVVEGVRKVLYYVPGATPAVVIKVDGEHRYYHESDAALDWSTFRAKWAF